METLPQPVQSLAKYVTAICDHGGYPLTPHDKGKPARLHDVVPGRSSDILDSWLDARTQEFRDNIEVVAIDGFTGYATAVDKNLPQATKVMDPFHVVHLGLDKLTGCRQHIQQSIYGRRGRSGDPLYGARRTLMTGAPLLTEFQYNKLVALFADERYLPVQVTWVFTQEIMAEVIRILSTGVPSELKELRTLGNTLKRRRKDILAFFDVGVSNGPVEATGGRLEHLRGIALGFGNLDRFRLEMFAALGTAPGKTQRNLKCEEPFLLVM